MTHTFKLVSGVEAEIEELGSKHWDILTKESRKETFLDRIDHVLAALIIRIGSVKNFQDKARFVREMLTKDREHLLFEARQYANDFEPTWEMSMKSEINKRDTFKVLVEISDNGFVPFVPMTEQYTEYSEIQRVYTDKLRSGLQYRMQIPCGNDERFIESLKTESTYNRQWKMRRYAEFSKTTKDGQDLFVEPSSFAKIRAKDAEALNKLCQSKEGNVFTIATFEDEFGETEQLNLLQQVAFIVPSFANH